MASLMVSWFYLGLNAAWEFPSEDYCKTMPTGEGLHLGGNPETTIEELRGDKVRLVDVRWHRACHDLLCHVSRWRPI